jgi:hypothetical protein
MGWLNKLTGKETPEEIEKRQLGEELTTIKSRIIEIVKQFFIDKQLKYDETNSDVTDKYIIYSQKSTMNEKFNQLRNIENEKFFVQSREENNIINNELSELINRWNILIPNATQFLKNNSNNSLNHSATGGGFTATSERVIINGKQNRIVYKKNGKGVGYVKMNGEFVKMNNKNIKK